MDTLLHVIAIAPLVGFFFWFAVAAFLMNEGGRR